MEDNSLLSAYKIVSFLFRMLTHELAHPNPFSSYAK